MNLTKDRFTRPLRVLVIVTVLLLFFCVAAYLVPANSVSQVITDDEIQAIYRNTDKVEHKSVETVIGRDRYGSVEKGIIRQVETPMPLRHFQNLDELEEWLESISVLDIGLDADGKENSKHVKPLDCDDYAMKLQERALSSGYIMSFEIIHPVEYNALFKQKRIPNDTIHAVNSVTIENEVYYIEPQTHEIVFVAYLD